MSPPGRVHRTAPGMYRGIDRPFCETRSSELVNGIEFYVFSLRNSNPSPRHTVGYIERRERVQDESIDACNYFQALLHY